MFSFLPLLDRSCKYSQVSETSSTRTIPYLLSRGSLDSRTDEGVPDDTPGLTGTLRHTVEVSTELLVAPGPRPNGVISLFYKGKIVSATTTPSPVSAQSREALHSCDETKRSLETKPNPHKVEIPDTSRVNKGRNYFLLCSLSTKRGNKTLVISYGRLVSKFLII